MADSDTGTPSLDSRIGLPGRISDLPPPRRRRHSTGPPEVRPRVETHTSYRVEEPRRRSGQRPPSIGPPRFAEYERESPPSRHIFVEEKNADSGHRRRRSRRYKREPSIPVADDSNSDEHQDAEDVLNDYLAGGKSYSAKQQRQSTFATYADEPARRRYPTRLRPGVEARMYGGYTNEEYASHKPVNAKETRLWHRAAKQTGPSRSSENLETHLTLIVMRRGARYRSQPFEYQTHSKRWTDARLARVLMREYRSLKTWGMWSFVQKFFAYKTIAFVYFLQSRYVVQQDDKRGGKGRWEITDTVPITDVDDDQAREGFMYQLRNPPQYPRYEWRDRLDELLEPGAVVDLEVVETFDAMTIYIALLFAILVSLGAALVYGFFMDRDFSTGFSIASWMLTAFGFFVAVVAAGEYFGLEKPVSFQTRAGLDKGVEWDPN